MEPEGVRRPPATDDGTLNFPELTWVPRYAVPRFHAAALAEMRMTFIFYPTLEDLQDSYVQMRKSMQRPPDPPAEPVFIGQVPHLVPEEIIAWAIDAVLRRYASVWMIRGRKTGCVKAWLRSREDVVQLVELSRLIIFDLPGVWLPSADPNIRRLQRDLLDEYAYNIKKGVVINDRRLPKTGLVCEHVGMPSAQRYSADEMASFRPRTAPRAVQY